MQWAEVRERFPNQFLLVGELVSHMENRELQAEDVAVIRPLADGKEAFRLYWHIRDVRWLLMTSSLIPEQPIR